MISKNKARQMHQEICITFGMFFFIQIIQINLFRKLFIWYRKDLNKYGAALLHRTICDFQQEMFALLFWYL